MVVAYVLFRLGRFVFVTGRWEIVRANLNLFMVGRYPRGELWRIVACLVGAMFLLGIGAGSSLQRQRREFGPPEPREPRRTGSATWRSGSGRWSSASGCSCR